MHVKDKDILREIQRILVPSPSLRGGDQRGPTGDPPPGVGKLYQQGPSAIQLRVENIRELEIVINHFNKFKLITKKEQDFKLFILVTEIIKRKEHLTPAGFR